MMDFFKKEYIYNAIWALIIAIIGFISGLIWKNYSGPDRVIIEKDESLYSKDTTITIVKFEGDSIAINAFKNFNPNLIVKSSNNNSLANNASIAQHKIEFSNIVKGYTQESLNSYASVEIPRLTYSKGEMIEFEMTIFDNNILKKISPVFIEIVKKTGENSITQVWEEQFKINNINNTIRFSSDFPKDEYQLAIGFYLMDELNQKYPPFYLKRVKIKII